jgi:putative acetyltransferase
MAITVEQVSAPNDEMRALIEALDATLAEGYPPENRHGLALAAIFQPHIRFFVARDGVARGCGGVAFFEGFAEVKRMFVVPAARGTGVAQAILARIEAEARAAGFSHLRLETGDVQHAAMRLYARAGFLPCPAFGDYLSMSPAALATSVFLEKRLTK